MYTIHSVIFHMMIYITEPRSRLGGDLLLAATAVDAVQLHARAANSGVAGTSGWQQPRTRWGGYGSAPPTIVSPLTLCAKGSCRVLCVNSVLWERSSVTVAPALLRLSSPTRC
jgi:hypothetical protein